MNTKWALSQITLNRPGRILRLAALAAACLLLRSIDVLPQNAEWMLFDPKSAGMPTANIMRLAMSPDGSIWTACTDAQSLTPHGMAVFDGNNWTIYLTFWR